MFTGMPRMPPMAMFRVTSPSLVLPLAAFSFFSRSCGIVRAPLGRICDLPSATVCLNDKAACAARRALEIAESSSFARAGPSYQLLSSASY